MPRLNRRALAVRTASALAAAVAFGALLPASAAGPLVDDSENYPGGAVIVGQNSGTGGDGMLGQALAGGDGIAGTTQSTTRTGNVGVSGSANAPSSYGVYGSGASPDSKRPSVGVYGVSTGSYGIYGASRSATAPAILGYDFTAKTGLGIEGHGSGNGVAGISAGANGVVGQTFVDSGLRGTGFAGVFGADESTDAGIGNSGVAGVTATGYGVSGTANSSGVGVAAFARSGPGLFGTSVDGIGIYGTSPGNIALEGSSTGGVGVVAESQATPDPGSSDGPPALLVSTDAGAPAVKVSGVSGDLLSLDGSGNLIVSGNVTVDGNLAVAGATSTCPSCPSPLLHEQKTASNVSVGTYASQATVRTIEDVGEAQLVDGRAYVALDAAFGAATDRNSKYLVFITPQGETRGLYVSQKTRSGFTVQEADDGRSTLAFDYRITAKPYGSRDARLPVLAAANTSVQRPLHTPASVLRFARFPLAHALRAPSRGAGFVPKAAPPSSPRLHEIR